MSRSKSENMRRLRLGNLRTLLRARCGHTLPNDDAGREYLWELLLPISLGTEADLKIKNTIEIWAPWLDREEARQLIDQMNRTPSYLRKPSAHQLGDRLRVSNRERERLKLWTIAPFDMTDAEFKEQRKVKDRARKHRLRRAAGSKPREQSLSRLKPWESAKVSRRTWFRRQAADGTNTSAEQECHRGTNSSAVKLLNSRGRSSATEKAERSEGLAIGVGQGREERDNTESVENADSTVRKARAVGS